MSLLRFIDHLERSNLVRAFIAVIMTSSVVYAALSGISVPQEIITLYAAIVSFYFSQGRNGTGGE